MNFVNVLYKYSLIKTSLVSLQVEIGAARQTAETLEDYFVPICPEL